MDPAVQIILAVIGLGTTAVAGPHLWRWLRSRPADLQHAETQRAQLQQQQTAQIIEQWQALAVASRQRADGLEARVAVLEAALEAERKVHAQQISKLRAELVTERNARIEAERRETLANQQIADLTQRIGVLESYVNTHAQLSVAAIQKGLMRALSERAPAGEIDAIVADVVAGVGPGKSE